jgi:hypothetical protein
MLSFMPYSFIQAEREQYACVELRIYITISRTRIEGKSHRRDSMILNGMKGKMCMIDLDTFHSIRFN